MIPIRQHVDVNASKANLPLELLGTDKLLISSYFPTIQGEGPFAGRRAFFIRTSGCNFGGKDVACAWCDTDFRIGTGTPMSFDELMDAATTAFPDERRPLIVVTGGEPLIQPNIEAFIEHMLDLGFEVQIETNGTFLHKLNHLAQNYKDFHIVCSPKQVKGRYASAAPAFRYDAAINKVHFKFVISVDAEVGHTSIPQWSTSMNWSTICWISPMTVYRKAYNGEVSSIWDHELVDAPATSANYRYAAELVMATPGARFTCQTHTLMAIA